MVIKVSQLPVTDIRIELVRQPHLTNRSLSLVTFKLTIQKLKTREVSLRKLRVEFLSAIDLLLCTLYQRRLRWLVKHRHIRVAICQLCVCQREVRVSLNGPFVKTDCGF